MKVCLIEGQNSLHYLRLWRILTQPTHQSCGMSDDEGENKKGGLNIRKYPQEVPVETKKERSGIRPTHLGLEVDLPGDTDVVAIVMQDITGDGDPDNRQKITALDGEHEYELTEFELHGYQVWTKFLLRSNDGQNTPSISSYELKGEKPK